MKGSVVFTLALLTCLPVALVTGCNDIRNSMYKSAIQTAIHEDALTGHEATADHVDAMRQVDLSNCPPEFREAYSHHIHAWDEAARAQEARAKLDNDEDAAAVAGLLAEVFGSDATPWGDHVQAVNRVNQLQAKAHDDIQTSWQAVEDVARKYGVQI